MPNTVKLRRGTATQWAANNPVLASGEVGVELSVSGTPQALKIGNGTSTWNALPYLIKAGGVPQPIAYGDAGAAGTSVEFARADHKHAAMAAPPTTPTTVSNESTNSTTSTSHTHALSGVLTKQRNFNFGEIHKFYSGTNGRSWLGLLNLTRFSFHPLSNALIMAGYVDWLYNLDRRADELGGDITFTQTANITPTIKTRLFTGVISQGCCTVDLTGVVESDPSTWAQFTIERTSGGNIFSSAGTASTLLDTIGFLSVMEGWGNIGSDGTNNVITSLLIEVKPTTGTYAGQWYTLYDHTEAMNHPLSLSRGICFSMTDQTLYTDGVVSYSGIRVSIRAGVPYSGSILRLGNFCVFSNYPVSDPANVAKALGQRGGKGYGTYTIVGSGTKALEIRTPSGAIVGTFRADNPRLGINTESPSESVDVNGNLRLRNIPTTVGTFCIEVDDNGVFRKRTFAQTLADLGASEALHHHTISDLSGVAPLVHNHDEAYISLTGKQTLTDISDKRNSWMPFAYLEIENNAVYRNSAEYCGVLHMQSYSDSREPQEMFNIHIYMQKRGWNTNQEFTNQVPELVICLDGNHNLASNDVVAIMTDTDSVSQVFTFYIRLSASNKSYRTKITSGKGISYGNMARDANDSYVTLKALKEEPAQVSLPSPAIGDVVEASLLTQVVPNSDVLTIHKNVNLQNQLTLAGTSILQRNSAGTLTVRTFAQTISDMNLLTTSHDALSGVHGRVITRRFSELTQEPDDLGRLAWLTDEKRMAYGLGYGGKFGVWQYLGITKVFPTVHDLMSETPMSEGIIACALQEKIAFVSFWNGSVYKWSPLVNEDELLRRSCLPWASLPSSPLIGHFQISYDKDVISFYHSSGGWRHLPVDSAQRIANPYDDYVIDPVLDKLILVDCTNNDVMITMPAIAQSMGREFIIRHHKGANVVKIVGQSSNTVDGLSLIKLTTEKDFVRLINDGNSDWCLVGGAYS